MLNEALCLYLKFKYGHSHFQTCGVFYFNLFSYFNLFIQIYFHFNLLFYSIIIIYYHHHLQYHHLHWIWFIVVLSSRDRFQPDSRIVFWNDGQSYSHHSNLLQGHGILSPRPVKTLLIICLINHLNSKEMVIETQQKRSTIKQCVCLRDIVCKTIIPSTQVFGWNNWIEELRLDMLTIIVQQLMDGYMWAGTGNLWPGLFVQENGVIWVSYLPCRQLSPPRGVSSPHLFVFISLGWNELF